MDIFDICNDTQEKIARGAPLDPAEATHASRCAGCAQVVADASLLEAALAALAPGVVPAGFADRVMVEVATLQTATTGPTRWLERRWVQIALAHVGAAFTVLNVTRLLMRILIPEIALGATP
jgi:hypothetical protein